MSKMYNPPHPGLLIADVIEGMKEEGVSITITSLAAHISITRATLSRIIHGHQAITPDIALRFRDALGIDNELLLRIQLAHDSWQAEQRPRPVISSLTAHHAVI